MKPLFKIALLGLLLILTGCVVTSVYPYYTEKDLVSDPNLPGTWKWIEPADSKETWTFVRAGASGYSATVTGESTNSYEAHLFKLDGQLFLDLLPKEPRDDFIPPHYLVKVLRLSPTLRVSVLDYEWLKVLVKSDPGAVRQHRVRTGDKPEDERIVLTGDTKELQRLVRKHVKTPDAWTEPSELARVPEPGQPSSPGKP